MLCIPGATSLKSFLTNKTIRASAPCRVDFGDSWDIEGLALLHSALPPITVNIALDLRTKVQLLPYKDGWVKISTNWSEDEEQRLIDANLYSPFRLIYAIAFYFAVSGVHIVIDSQIPPRSGLGGSGTLAVAVIACISKTLASVRKTDELEKHQIVRIAHDIEDSLRISYTGMQDQAAAVYGGVNKWQWNYQSLHAPFIKEELINDEYQSEFGEHLLAVYINRDDWPENVTEKEIAGFLNNSTRKYWYSMHSAGNNFAQAVREHNWKDAALLLQKGTQNRLMFIKDTWPQAALDYLEVAKQLGCGAAFAGAPKGVIWAIGPKNTISHLRKRWEKLINLESNGYFLPNKVDFVGLKIS